MSFKITELYAFITVARDGSSDEGVMAAEIPSLGGMVPLIGADKARIESLREYAEMVGRASGQGYRLKRFVLAETLEEHPRRN